MTRSGNHLKVTVPQRRALQRLARGAGSAAAGLRATIVLLSSAGESAAHIARALGVSPRMVRDCRRRWRLGGLAGLKDARRPGRPSRADAGYVRLLVQMVQTDPRQVGYAFSRWTAPRLSEYLRHETGIVLSAYWVGELLRMHGFVWKRSKRTTRNCLPKYTSETLNPIESLWGHLKEAYFSRMLTKRREDFYAAVVHLLEQLGRPGGFRRLFSSARPRRLGKDLPRMA